MKDYYDPNNLLKIDPDEDKDFIYVDSSMFVKTNDEPLFHVKQSYATEPVKQLECVHCGGTEFNVGQGDYVTAIRCIKCGWEVDVHNG